MKVLIIEDQTELAKNMVQYLRQERYVCDAAYTALEAVEKILLFHYDCIVLDISLPHGNGLAVMNTLRKYKKDSPVILTTPEDPIIDQLPGFDASEDYLTKPFSLSQLAEKISAAIRRQKLGSGRRLEFDTIAIDLLGKTVSIQDNEVRLTRKEYDLLVFLASNRDRVVSKNAIAEHLTGEGDALADNFDFIYSHMKNLKKKLIDAGGKNYIRTMYGMGYKFCA